MGKIKRIGIFGGTFNPPHKAHIEIAKQAKKQFMLDKIFFIPAYIPPHKLTYYSAEARDRLKMVKLAIGKQKGFKVSDIELKRRGISYTIDTLEAFKKKYPRTEFMLIIGADNLTQFHAWKSRKKILQLVSLIVYKRKGYNLTLREKIISYSQIKGRFYYLSSTEARKRIAEGKSTSKMIQKSVGEYIRKHSLYKRSV